MKVLQLLWGAGALVGSVNANFDVMEVMEKSYKKLMLEGFFQREKEFGSDSVLNNAKTCTNGKVTINNEDFPCEEVDFLSFLSMNDLEIPFPAHRSSVGRRSSDIWGWTGPSGREFTLLALDNGGVLIDSTDATNPCIVAKMPTRRVVDIWGDIKVHDNTMYHVKDTGYFRAQGLSNEPDETAHYGIEVYDLLPFDQIDCHVENFNPLMVWPNKVFTDHGRSHNLVVDPESGLLFSVGTERCNGGFLVLDVKTDRLNPTEVACVSEDNYTHDAQCLVYDGPDTRYTGSEICFGFNEDTLTVWDFTDLQNYKMLSRTFYPNQAFSHQGWVTNDLTKVLLDDELDEVCNNGNPTNSRRCNATSTFLTGLKTTATYVLDITDLEHPVYQGFFDHKDLSVDHNLYVWGDVHRRGWGGNPPMANHPDPNYAYMNNYLAGLKIVDIHSTNYEEWFTAGSFDISPEKTAVEFAGAWSGYMHPSGVYAISSIERGLFLLSPRMAFTDEFPKGTAEINEFTRPSGDEGKSTVEKEGPSGFVKFLGAMAAAACLTALIIGVALRRKKNEQKKLVLSQKLFKKLSCCFKLSK